MNDSSDLRFPAGRNARARAEGWPLAAASRRILGRAAVTEMPILLARAREDWFMRIATAIHEASQRDHLILLDLRDSTRIRLPSEGLSRRSTLALDGIEMLDLRAQENLLDDLDLRAPRLISGSALDVAELGGVLLPELLALLATVDLEVPNLDAAPEQVVPLALERLATLAGDLGMTRPDLSDQAQTALAAHDWRGGDTELDGVLARTLLALAPGAPIDARDLVWASTGPAASPREEPAAPAPVAPMQADSAPPESAPPATRATATTAAIAATAQSEQHANGSLGPPRSNIEALAIELAHNLKNPLVTLKTFVANAARLGEDPERLARFSALADESIERMDATLDELLDFARLREEEPRSVEVFGCLRAALRDIWDTLDAKQVVLEGPTDETLPSRLGPAHLTFALRTLARYLEDAVEPQGTLTIARPAAGRLELRFPEAASQRHLREALHSDDESFPLSLLLVRGALTHVGASLAVERNESEIRLLLGFPDE
ncbi:MAG: histidine kinase dimerization/phospho-acceptor domain-containing protein [Deltaproteobacteria bacterium]